MLYIVSFLLPPLAVAMALEGKHDAGSKIVLNVLLTVLLCGIGGMIHALMVVSENPRYGSRDY